MYPIFHAVASFYVLNWKFIDAGFEMSPANERKVTIKLIGNHLSWNDIFLSIKENSIKQEFYSVLIKYNLIMQYTNEAETVVYWCKKTEKLDYKCNVWKAVWIIIIPQIPVILFSKKNKLSNIIICFA